MPIADLVNAVAVEVEKLISVSGIGPKLAITVLSGLGGLGEIVNRQKLGNVPQGGSVWTFALVD